MNKQTMDGDGELTPGLKSTERPSIALTEASGSTNSPNGAVSEGEVYHQEELRMCQIIGNWANSFIITCNGSKIYLIDQHAASEKNLYLQYLKTNVKKPLFFPQSGHANLMVENIYKETLREKEQEMMRLGWEYQIVREGPIFMEVEIQCFPSLFGKPSPNIEHEFLEDLERVFEGLDASQGYSKPQKDSLATTACHRAYRIGDQLSKGQIREIIDLLQEGQNGVFNCPHGRPTMIGLGEAISYFPVRRTKECTLL